MNILDYYTRKSKLIQIIFIILILIIWVTVGFHYMRERGLFFDEAVDLQAPVSFARNNTYQTSHYGGFEFDPLITTGPTVLMPIALIFKIFGVGIVKARLVMIIYSIVFILSIYWYSKKFFGNNTTVIFLLLIFVLLIPGIFFESFHVLGEIPALSFLFLGLIFLTRKKFLFSGIFFGLSILTKTLIGLIIPSLIIAILYLFLINKKERFQLKLYIKIFIGILIPFILWELFKLIDLGFIGYKENIIDTFDFFIQWSFQTGESTIEMRIDTLSLYRPKLPGLVMLVTLLLAFHIYLIDSRSEDNLPNYADIVLLSFSVIFLFWWLFFSGQTWRRHLLPGFVTFLYFFIYMINFVYDKLIHLIKSGISIKNKYHNVRIAGGITLLVILSAFIAYTMFMSTKTQKNLYLADINTMKLSNQIEVANDISTIIEKENGLIGYIGWWQAPEISFLTSMTFYDITVPQYEKIISENIVDGRKGFIIISPMFKYVDPDVAEWILSQYETYYEKYDYSLLEYSLP